MISALMRTAILALAMTAALSACGRKGDLDPPGTPQQPAASVEATAPQAQAPDRKFILDGLLE